MLFARRMGGAFLALCTFFTIAALAPQPQASAQAAPDFACTVTIRDGDAVLAFSGADVGTPANLRNASSWIATVTGSTEHRVPAEVGQSYTVVLNSFGVRVGCTSPSQTPVSFSCIQLAIRDHTRLAFSCLLYTSPSPRDATLSRMPSSA